jgi:hypothetical protein
LFQFAIRIFVSGFWVLLPVFFFPLLPLAFLFPFHLFFFPKQPNHNKNSSSKTQHVHVGVCTVILNWLRIGLPVITFPSHSVFPCCSCVFFCRPLVCVWVGVCVWVCVCVGVCVCMCGVGGASLLTTAHHHLQMVDYMARFLSALGPTNHVESFTQNADYAQGRALRDWFVECPDEPCKMEVRSSQYSTHPSSSNSILLSTLLVAPHVLTLCSAPLSRWTMQ